MDMRIEAQVAKKTIVSRIALTVPAIALMAALMVPLAQMVWRFWPERPLYGYVPPEEAAPRPLLAAVLDGRFQTWAETYISTHVGFRADMLRTFNEAEFRLFGERRNIGVIYDSTLGTYADLQIQYLNGIYDKKDITQQSYARMASKMAVAQAILASKGKYFLNIVAASKTFIYPHPLGTRYLSDDPNFILGRVPNYEKFANEYGVNSIDFDTVIRDMATQQSLPLYSTVGVHWGQYTGCLAAAMAMDKIRSDTRWPMARLDCGVPRMAPAQGIDTDGLLLMNIWSHDSLLPVLPYPSPTAAPTAQQAFHPRVLVIGDSFSGQMIDALLRASILGDLRLLNYFRAAFAFDNVQSVPVDFDFSAQGLKQELDNRDLIILETVDYNMYREGYGFLDRVIESYAAPYTWGQEMMTADNAAQYLVSGWTMQGAVAVATDPRAQIVFHDAKAPPAGDLGLHATVTDRSPKGSPHRVHITANGQAIASFMLSGGETQDVAVRIPASITHEGEGNMVLTFLGDDADHSLALELRGLVLEPAQ